MTRQFQPIETPLGFVAGRNGIYLDRVIFRDGTNTLVLEGEFSTSLCSRPGDIKDAFQGYRITFSGVLATSIIELDSWDWECESSFDEIIDSDWIKELEGKVTGSNRHFLIQTYDDVIEVVCDTYLVELTSNKT